VFKGAIVYPNGTQRKAAPSTMRKGISVTSPPG
jgi:hypothetical protein